MAQVLDGNRIRDEIKNECRSRVEKLVLRGRAPGLAVVLVGHNPASEIYVRNKVKTSHELGIAGETITPPENITTEELLAIIDSLNQRPDIDGILVQMPLAAAHRRPAHSGSRLAPEGRRRPAPLQRGQSRHRPARPAPLHPGRHHRTAEALPHSHCRQARRGRRPQRYGRQAHGPAAAS